MFKKLVLPAMLAAFFACPGLAQTPSAYQLQDNAGAKFLVKDFICGSINPLPTVCPASVPIDVFGNPLAGGAGTTNPNGTALYVQGVTGGVPLTVNLGTLNGAATATLQNSILTAIGGLGVPLQQGGSVGITGTPTVNLGSIGGAATQTTLAAVLTALGTPLQAGGQVTNAGTFAVQLTGAANNINNIAGTISLPTGASTAALQTTGNTSLSTITTNTGTTNTDIGAPGAVACATDTSSCSLNQIAQRLAQRLTTINTTLGTPFQAGASIANTAFGISGTLPAFAATPTFNIGTAPTIAVTGTFFQATQPISAVSLPLPTGAATSANQSTAVSSLATIATNTGSVNLTSLSGTSLVGGGVAGLLAVGGNVASAATDSANPVKVGGVFHTSLPTFTDGQRGDLQIGQKGALITQLTGANTTTAIGAAGTGSDGIGAFTALGVASAQLLENGTNFDRAREISAALTSGMGTAAVAIAPTSAAAAGITPVLSGSAVSGLILKASAGNLYSVYATNATTTPGYLMTFNSTTVPADGPVTPVDCVPIPASSSTLAGNASLSNGSAPPDAFSAGISVAVSSTGCFTKTTSGSPPTGGLTAFIKGRVQ